MHIGQTLTVVGVKINEMVPITSTSHNKTNNAGSWQQIWSNYINISKEYETLIFVGIWYSFYVITIA